VLLEVSVAVEKSVEVDVVVSNTVDAGEVTVVESVMVEVITKVLL